MIPSAISQAIQSLSDLPGIGSRSAERLVFMLLRNESGLDQKIAASLGQLKANVKECETCFHYCEKEKCGICDNPSRDDKTICVVESPMDLIALERTHEFSGTYHVLHGLISPLNRIRPEDLRISPLYDRLEQNNAQEVILALTGNIEGEATSLYLMENLKKHFAGKVTRLARGIPSGGDLDYLDIGTLSRAIMDRREF